MNSSALARARYPRSVVISELSQIKFEKLDIMVLRKRYALQLVGRAKDIRQRFFAISVERKIKHPAVAAICEVARKKIFA